MWPRETNNEHAEQSHTHFFIGPVTVPGPSYLGGFECQDLIYSSSLLKTSPDPRISCEWRTTYMWAGPWYDLSTFSGADSPQ